MASAQRCVPAPPSVHSSIGREESWENIDVYVNWPVSSTAAVVLIADVFGWKAPLLRKLADKVAAAGFVAVVPDLCYGDSFEVHSSLQAWLQNHKPDAKPVEDSKKLVHILHSKGIPSIGFSGFCWGAKVAICVAKEAQCNAAVLCHPSFVTIDDLKACAVPLSVLAAEADHKKAPEMVDEFKKHLENTNKDHFVKIFPGTPHGWAVRYDVNDETAVKNAEESHQDFLAWFQKHLY